MTVAVVWASPVSANGFRLGDQDAFATARGGAFVATADNPSAVYYNPAGIAQLQGTQLRSGIYGVYYDPTFRPPAGSPNSPTTYHLDDNLAAAPQLFFTRSLESVPLSLGLGVYAPFGGSMNWPQDTGFRSVATKSSLTYLRFNPVAAWQLPWGVSLGCGATANYAKLLLEQGLRPNAAPLANFFRFQGDGWSAGYNAGLFWQPQEKIAFGATFRSATTFTLKGSTEIERQFTIPPTKIDATTDLTFPWTTGLGLSYRPTPKWNLELDADYTDWSSLGVISVRQQTSPPYPVQQNIPVTLEWQGSWNYSAGVTRYFEGGWHASAGYLYSRNSVPDAYYTPLAADLDRHFLSLGLGRKGKRFDCDLAYQFGYGPSHTVSGSMPSSTPGQFAGQSADGTYGFISHALTASLGMHF